MKQPSWPSILCLLLATASSAQELSPSAAAAASSRKRRLRRRHDEMTVDPTQPGDQQRQAAQQQSPSSSLPNQQQQPQQPQQQQRDLSNIFHARAYVPSAHRGPDNDNNENDTSPRYLVEINNERGRSLVLKAALMVHYNIPGDNTLSVDLPVGALPFLRASAGIRSIDPDSLWTEQGYLERIVDEEELRGVLHKQRKQRKDRHLQDTADNEEEVVPYGVSLVQADQLDIGPHPVMVCIIDTGIATDHPDIRADLASGSNRVNFGEDGSVNLLHWNNDTRGHGTHVGGTIMATADNGLGVRGIGAVPLYVTRGLDDSGNAFESDIRQAMEQCELAGTKVVSLSLGGSKMSSSMKAICERMYHERDMLIFAAAGNSGEWRLEYPASDPTVISVSAVDESAWYWSKSNYGPTLELMAPGVGILSTTTNATGHMFYAKYSGTSMAVPHASGAAALVWSHFPECTNEQIRFVLAATAMDKGQVGCDTDFGYGIVQVKNAYDFLSQHSCTNPNWGLTTKMMGNCTELDLPHPDVPTVAPKNERPSLGDNKKSDTVPHPSLAPVRPPIQEGVVPDPYQPPASGITVPAEQNPKYDDIASSAPSSQPSKIPSHAPSLAPTLSPTPKRETQSISLSPLPPLTAPERDNANDAVPAPKTDNTHNADADADADGIVGGDSIWEESFFPTLSPSTGLPTSEVWSDVAEPKTQETTEPKTGGGDSSFVSPFGEEDDDNLNHLSSQQTIHGGKRFRHWFGKPQRRRRKSNGDKRRDDKRRDSKHRQSWDDDSDEKKKGIWR